MKIHTDRATGDFETRSRADLLVVGADKYARDRSTEVICLSFLLPGEDPDKDGIHEWWNPYVTGFDLPADNAYYMKHLRAWIRKGGKFEAHNWGFEYAIWNNVCVPALGWEPMTIEQGICSAAKSAYYALPRSLEMVAKALQIRDLEGNLVEKDNEGYRLMLELSKPQGDRFVGTPDQFKRLIKYCSTDVRTEHFVSCALPDIPEKEQEIWRLDQIINTRGLYLDKDMAQAAFDADQEFSQGLRDQLPKLTGGMAEKPTQRARIKAWCESMSVQLKDTKGTTVDRVLKDPKVPDVVKQVLIILRMGNRTSTAKYRAMLDMVCEDFRIRGSMMYHGATTGRWSGKGLQPHNFPRGDIKETTGIKDIEEAMEAARRDILYGLEWLSMVYDDVGKLLSDALRGAICAPPGKKLVVCDFAAIEGRVLPWLANDQELLDVFRRGDDVYCFMADAIYGYKTHKSTHPDERFVGKQAILGLGFGMGAKRFLADLAEKFDVHLPKKFIANVVKVYRTERKPIVKFWHDIEECAIAAVQTGKPVEMPEGKLTWYTKKYEGVGIFLHCRLPSGRSLSYPFPMLRKDATYFFDVKRTVQTPEGDTVSETESLRISVPNGKDLAIRAFREAKRIAQLEDVELLVSLQDVVNKEPSLKYTLTFMVMNAVTKQWERGSTYGGMLTENVTQAVARDCMAWSMLRLESFPFYELVLSVHDEAVGEAPLDDPRASYKHMEEEMARGEDWSEGLPIAVEGWEGRMYRK